MKQAGCILAYLDKLAMTHFNVTDIPLSWLVLQVEYQEKTIPVMYLKQLVDFFYEN